MSIRRPIVSSIMNSAAFDGNFFLFNGRREGLQPRPLGSLLSGEASI